MLHGVFYPLRKNIMNDKKFNEISLKMQELNLELDKLNKRRYEIKESQSLLIANWSKEATVNKNEVNNEN